jgi:cytochrome c2
MAATVASSSKLYGQYAQNSGRDCSGDAEAGRKVFVEHCSMYHSAHPGGKIVGPSLNGMCLHIQDEMSKRQVVKGDTRKGRDECPDYLIH